MKRQRQHGFTLLEVTFGSVLLASAMGMIAMCIDTSNRSLHADDVVAQSMEALQRSAVRIAQVMRPCSLVTYRVLSTTADVPALAADAGEWIEPVDGERRAAIQFRCASGIESMNASALTTPRLLHLELDRRETANGADDDGDGMVDEGDVVLDYDDLPVRLASKVETMSFTLTGRLLEIRLQSAGRRRDGTVQRFTVHETLYLRNN